MKIFFVSLGCDKNLVDTEKMLGQLYKKGYEFTDDENDCDVVVVNTCCFIGDAKEESINTLLEMGRLRTEGKIKALVAAGCLAQRYHDEIMEEIPEVDAVVGTTAIGDIVDCIESVLNKAPQNYIHDINDKPYVGDKRILTTGGHFSYLKIAEGCDKRCTYCIIPKVRGNYRSIPMEELVREAETLAEQGVKELILVAQETTVYGMDLYGKKMLPELLRRLCKISGLFWIRILYCYPEEITDELIEVMKTETKICHYLDMPIQHASDAVLHKMGRKTNCQELKEMIGKLRKEIPDICLRTTLIAGFPGETQNDHEFLMDFVEEMRFDRLGVFTYSQEENTVAAEMPDQIDEDTKVLWQQEIMELQMDIAFEKAEEMVGKQMVVMIEGAIEEDNAYVARTYRDAPNVDGYLFLNTTANLMTGDLVKVVVTDSNEYDLIGEIDGGFDE